MNPAPSAPSPGDYAAHFAAARAAADAPAQGIDLSIVEDEAHLAAVQHALAAFPQDIDILFAAFQFYFRTGRFDPAEAVVRRRIALLPKGSAAHARALTNLGLIEFKRGRLDDAEPLFQQAVDIDRRLGNAEGLARDLGNLSLVPEARGGPDLARAEALLHEAIEASRPLQPDLRDQNIAGFSTNLGDIAWTRGEFETARRLWKDAAAVFDRLGVRKWQREFAERFARPVPAAPPRPPRAP